MARLLSHLAVGIFASLATYMYIEKRRKRKYLVGCPNEQTDLGWLSNLCDDPHLEDVDLLYREWNDEIFRKENGWSGQDFMHNKKSNGPRILRYFFDRSSGTLVGIVTFGPDSESHAGYCHGGSMTAVLDDVLGHTAFVAGKGPWSGATVVVNCTLKKPVKVGQVLKVWGRVKDRQGRKTFIEGGLIAENGDVHATSDGITMECTRQQLFGE